MSDNDVVSRKDVLNMAYLSVFVDNDGHEVDEPRYVIDASDVERLPAAEQPMSARELLLTEERMIREDADAYREYAPLAWNRKVDEAVAFAERWAREHPRQEREEANDERGGL